MLKPALGGPRQVYNGTEEMVGFLPSGRPEGAGLALAKAVVLDSFERRAALLEVVTKWPWTPAAWTAAAELK